MVKNNNLICATILTGVYDVNRNERLVEDDFDKIKTWYNSLVRLQLRGVVFHNSFTEETVSTYQNDFVSFKKVDYDVRYNPNVYRYLIYQDFIQTHFEELDNLFFTDITDVEVVNNPFIQPLFLQQSDALFCGDEPKILDNEWMHHHSTFLRQSIPDFAAFEFENQNQILLNCGIFGGNKHVLKALLDKLAHIHRTYTRHNTTPSTLDMGAFNYVVRTQFAHNLCHGLPVNTVFKQYETHRKDCWFRHK